jgi:hypothetical protein
MDDTAPPTVRLGVLAPALFAGALGLAPLGLQPILAQASATDAAASAIGAGVVSGCELAAMGLACALFVVRPLPPVLYGLMMALGHAAALCWPELALGARILAGLGEGGLCAVAVRALLCGSNPIRAASLFTGLSALPQIAGWLVQLRYPGPFSASLCLVAAGALVPVLAHRCAHEPPHMPRRDRMDFRAALRLLGAFGLVAILNFAGSLVWVDLALWLDRHAYAAGESVTRMLFACMLGQIVATFLMARFGPERRVAHWLIAACALEALGVSGLLVAPTGLAFAGAGIVATAAWQATLPLATGLYLAMGGRSRAQFVLPVSLCAMALASGLADAVSAQRIILCLALVVVVLGFGVAGRRSFLREPLRRALRIAV